MKTYSILTLVAFLCIIASCKKNICEKEQPGVRPLRKARYELYTIKDFTGNKKQIDFRFMMRKGSTELFDSSLATMTLDQLPDFDHRIIVEKLVPGNDPASLEIGIIDFLEDVGSAWRIDTFPEGDSIKVLRWPFE